MSLLEILSFNSDIILLQEHKLWGFEKLNFFERLSKTKEGLFLTNWSIHIKSYDDEEQIPPKQAPRGQAGTAILYSNSIAHLIKNETDESHRFTVVTVKCNPNSICMISANLPSTYNKKGENHIDLFKESLDELESISDKYKSLGYTILIAGDTNNSETKRSEIFEKFLEKNNLKKSKNSSPETPTFVCYNGRDTSNIDNIITSKEAGF